MWSNNQEPRTLQSEGKLAEIRKRTDRDLAALLHNTIDESFQELERGNRVQAEIQYAQAATLLRLLRRLPALEFRALSIFLGALRSELDKSESHAERLAS